jgi:hypothetical protein
VNAIISFLLVSANVNVIAAKTNTANISVFMTSPLREDYRRQGRRAGFEKGLNPDCSGIIDLPQPVYALSIRHAIALNPTGSASTTHSREPS